MGVRGCLIMALLALWSGMANASNLLCPDDQMPVTECLDQWISISGADVDASINASPGDQAQRWQSLEQARHELLIWRETLTDDDIKASADAALSRMDRLEQQLLDHYRQGWAVTSLGEGLLGNDPLTTLPGIFALESRTASDALWDLQARWQNRLDDSSAGLTRYRDLVGTVLVLGLAVAVFIMLHRLARRSTGTLLQIHNLMIERAAKRRWMTALARLFRGAAPLAPWIVLWLLLSGFAAVFSGSNAALLLWWVPLAHLYILYGIACLLAEWLLLRVTSAAGVFLNNEQNSYLALHARSRVRWMIWPWVVLYVIDHWIGPSLLYRLIELTGYLVIWFALGSLLRIRRQDYVTSLQRLLPATLDPLAEKLLSEKRFVWNAALWLPLQLLLFTRQYLDQLLSDFDWYRSLSARWFRMRTQSQVEQEDGEIAEEEICEQYEQWFTAEGPDEVRLPSIDTGLLHAMRKPVDAWYNDRTDENTLLITGEKGIGKSAALARLDEHIGKEFTEVHTHRIRVPVKNTRRESVYQMVGELLGIDMTDGPRALVQTDNARHPTVIMLDEAQNLFLAEVGYLDGWRALLDLTNAKVENLFWVIAINNQSWAYLCNVFGREYQMRHVVRVKRWSQNEIRSLILSRNHLSGYKLRYDDILLATRGPDAGNLRNAEQRYFSLLWDSCRGVPLTALDLWLTSIRTEDRTVVVGLPQVPGSGQLETLGPKLLFIYAAIATHENLTSEEIGMVTNQPENVVRYALKAAMDAEFIARGDDGRYRITPLWYHTVISYLTRKNMLHE
ncbi:MAG: ATP-binding protein [Alcanivoracaceae bacterium]